MTDLILRVLDRTWISVLYFCMLAIHDLTGHPWHSWAADVALMAAVVAVVAWVVSQEHTKESV